MLLYTHKLINWEALFIHPNNILNSQMKFHLKFGTIYTSVTTKCRLILLDNNMESVATSIIQVLRKQTIYVFMDVTLFQKI